MKQINKFSVRFRMVCSQRRPTACSAGARGAGERSDDELPLQHRSASGSTCSQRRLVSAWSCATLVWACERPRCRRLARSARRTGLQAVGANPMREKPAFCSRCVVVFRVLVPPFALNVTH